MQFFFQISLFLLFFSTLSITDISYSHNISTEHQGKLDPIKEKKLLKDPVNEPELSMFKQALIAADLGDIFEGTGPFTAFAPTNEAFEKLGKDRVNNLLKPENKDELASLLMYHIVHGRYGTNALKPKELKTLNGKNITIQITDGSISVNGAKAIRTDMNGSYGVIHEIDTVLVP